MPSSKFETLTLEPANLVGMTSAHNSARARASPVAARSLPPLIWSSTIAKDAQNYANLCRTNHSGTGVGSIYGQNIYRAVPGYAYSVPDIVGKSWVGEIAYYNYATNHCASGKVCGHYTQAVWATTTHFGCGTKKCSTNSPFGSAWPNWQVWICNYNPPGNYGPRPHACKTGAATMSMSSNYTDSNTTAITTALGASFTSPEEFTPYSTDTVNAPSHNILVAIVLIVMYISRKFTAPKTVAQCPKPGNKMVFVLMKAEDVIPKEVTNNVDNSVQHV